MHALKPHLYTVPDGGGASVPQLRGGRCSCGYVFFPMARGDATIILATGTGRQMSALPVKG